MVTVLTAYIRPYQINLMFHGSADSVFVTNQKITKNVFVSEGMKPGGRRLCGYQYVVSLAESIIYHEATIEDGSFFHS